MHCNILVNGFLCNAQWPRRKAADFRLYGFVISPPYCPNEAGSAASMGTAPRLGTGVYGQRTLEELAASGRRAGGELNVLRTRCDATDMGRRPEYLADRCGVARDQEATANASEFWDFPGSRCGGRLAGHFAAGEALAVTSAAIVVDAKTGKVLYSSNADAKPYPASLTKMMTLYLLFEAIDRGRSARDPNHRVRNTPPPSRRRSSACQPGRRSPSRTRSWRWSPSSANDMATAHRRASRRHARAPSPRR